MANSNQQWQPNGAAASDNEHANYPPGYRFDPTDEDLVGHYLAEYMSRRRESPDQPPAVSGSTRRRHMIPEVDVYKFGNPNAIKEQYPLGGTSKKNEWYFFTPLSKKYPKGDRPSRTCGDKEGFWKPTGKDKDIFSNGVSGKKKCLEYFQGKPPGRKTDWKMHEYKIDDQSGDKNRQLNPALCRIYLNTKKRDKNVDVNDDVREVEAPGLRVVENGETEQQRETRGSSESPVEGGDVAIANANQGAVHQDQNVDTDNHFDFRRMEFYCDESVMDPEAWYNFNQFQPQNYSALFAYNQYEDAIPPTM